MWLRLLLLSAVTLVTGCASEPTRAPAPATAPAPEQAPGSSQEWRLLREARAFMSDAVGEGGDLPDVVIAYRQLLRAPDGAASFERLLREASPAGRLYALCGLLELETARAAELAGPLLADATPVAVQQGCLWEEEPLAALARRLLDDGDEELTSWRADIRGTGQGWREGQPFAAARPATDLVEALEALGALDVALGSGPPPPWSPTGTELDEERAEALAERELERLDDCLAGDPLEGPRDALAERLADRGPAAVPALAAALRHRSPSARLVALRALEQLGPWADDASGPILDALDDPDVRVRWTVIRLHSRRPGPAAEACLLRALDRPGEESELLYRALKGLGSRRLGPGAVAHLVPLLRHRHPEVAELAAYRLADVEPGPAAAAEALPHLVAAVREWPERRVSVAMWALGAMPEELVAPALADLLVEVEGARQADVADALSSLSAAPLELAVQRVLGRTAPERARVLAAARPGPERVAALAAATEELTLPPRLVALVALGHEPEGAPVLERVAATSGEGAAEWVVATDALARLGRAGLPALGRVASIHRVADALRGLLASDEPLDRAAALEWLAAAPFGVVVEAAVLQSVAGWLEPPGARPLEWDAAVGILLRWSSPRAVELLERLAADERAPADVRRRVAEALGR